MIRYNMDILSEHDELDALYSVKCFKTEQDYFNALTRFSEASYNDIRFYNPTVVILSEDICKDFLVKLDEIKNTALDANIAPVILQIENMEEAVAEKHEKQLSDGMSTFAATMDIVIKYISAARLPDIPRTSAAAPKPLILAVDDKPELLCTINGMLSGDFKIIGVTSARAALKALEKHIPDLFLLDIEMPETDGFALACTIRADKKFENTPILFLTGKNSKEHVMTAIKTGVNDYILKPVNKQTLISKINKYLAAGR